MAIIHLTAAARQAISDALAAAGEAALRLSIGEDFGYELRVGEAAAGDLAIEDDGVTILLDPDSARRGEGLTIDFVTTSAGSGFAVDNPNQPKVHQLSAPELKAMIDGGAPIVLMDVRTEEERAIASIEGSRLLTQEAYEHIMTLDRTTPLVFQCHHGIRSQAAAEYCLQEGFRRVFNLTGGIDAWSRLVDPSVARY